MIHSVRFTWVEIRDILFWFAHYDLYTPKWSKHIFDEWAAVMKKKGASEEQISKRVQAANEAFPDAMVENYEPLIKGLTLKKDTKDNHVLAAAIKTNANIIVTNNLKDFPEKYLNNFGLSAKNADDFITDIIDLDTDRAGAAFRKLVLNRRNPDLDEYQVLDRLRSLGLTDTADYLHSQL